MSRRRLTRLVVLAALAALALAACTNDPFDPASVPNARPVMSFFVEPAEPDGELNPTSYFERSFHWSGTDRDGFVEEYYVSIRTVEGEAAPWDTTTRTDTTMTFQTDDEGNAEATFLLACRDDQGAYSDTLVQYVPLRNFPPAVNYQIDFEPLRNLQREFVMEGDAVTDTIYWNWGVMTLRLFAFDLDGRETMDQYYRYTCADTDPTEIRPWDDPGADPMLHWLEAPFTGSSDIREFEVRVSGLPAGQRTLTVAVADEAEAETRLTYTWEVRDPAGQVLMVPDNSSTYAREFYREFAAEFFGPEGWDEYDFWFGFPDDSWVVLESMRRFDVVFWYDGGATSGVLQEAAVRDGVLQEYVQPTDGAAPGRLLMISRNLTGSRSEIPYNFRQAVIGVSPQGSPAATLEPRAAAVGAQALGTQDWLTPMTVDNRYGRGIGLSLLAGTEELYRFEECVRCFGGQTPFDPIIGARVPDRTVEILARTVGLSYQLEYLNHDESKAALTAILEHELGVTGR